MDLTPEQSEDAIAYLQELVTWQTQLIEAYDAVCTNLIALDEWRAQPTQRVPKPA
jgi:hypothetical protein